MNNKFLTTIIVLIVGFGALLYIIQYAAIFKGSISSTNATSTAYTVEEVVRGLEIPWSIVFTSQDRMLVTERPGRIRVIQNGNLIQQPLHTFSEVSVGGEEGLMSLALDPHYAENKLVYVSMAYEQGGNMFVKVERFKDDGNSVSGRTVIVDKIPAAQFHAGSRIAFGPEGKLYITTGDATNKDLAQNSNSLAGKILAVNSDGSGLEIYSLGHRNPQGLAWHPITKELYSTEHGPSVFDGPAGGDEVNHIVKGGNYGWPLVSHNKTRAGTVAPLLVFTPAEAPGSAMFYSGDVFPQFKNNLFFGALKGEGIIRVVLDEQDPKNVISREKISGINVGRIRDVVQGPDGYIYFSTSNRDGRGEVNSGDDKIYRLRPKM